MDFSDFGSEKANSGAVMEVRHPGTGLIVEGATLTLLGEDSDAYQNAMKAKAQKRMNSRKAEKYDADAVDRESLALLAKLTVDHAGIEWKGEPFPATDEGRVAMYKSLRWLRLQADAFIHERANFLPDA